MDRAIDAGRQRTNVWIGAEDRDTAFEQFEQLSAVNILTNYRLLPYGLGYGLRLGTTASSVAGVDVEHLVELAELIHSAVTYGASEALRRRVRELAHAAHANAIVPAELWAGPVS